MEFSGFPNPKTSAAGVGDRKTESVISEERKTNQPSFVPLLCSLGSCSPWAKAVEKSWLGIFHQKAFLTENALLARLKFSAGKFQLCRKILIFPRRKSKQKLEVPSSLPGGAPPGFSAHWFCSSPCGGCHTARDPGVSRILGSLEARGVGEPGIGTEKKI